MPFINGRYYMNPAYGRAVESARGAEATSDESGPSEQDQSAHWVTIDGRHVLIQDVQSGRANNTKKSEQGLQPKKATQASTRAFSGDATYYNLPGRKTASGAEFDRNKMAAAMTKEKVRLGQTATVTYTHEDEQGKTVTRTIDVVVNDRGPFARDADGKAAMPLQPAPGRVIDLTPAAFEKLVGTTRPGHVHVTVTVPND